MNYVAVFPAQAGLPDAPLHMPKQKLERRRSLIQTIRATLWPLMGR